MSTLTASHKVVFRDVVRLEPAEVVEKLRQILGAKLVAYIGGVNETRAVRQWAEGSRSPSADDTARLRLALQAASIVAGAESDSVVQAWFMGMNPDLDDHAVATVIREGSPTDVGPAVIAAAKGFASGE